MGEDEKFPFRIRTSQTFAPNEISWQETGMNVPAYKTTQMKHVR